MKKILKIMLYILTISAITMPMFIKALGFYLCKSGLMYSTNFLNHGRIFYFLFIPLFLLYIYDLLKVRKKIDIFDILFYIFLIISFFCIIFSKSYIDAIFGCDRRFHGFFAILSFNLLLNNWKNYGELKDYKKIIKIIICIGIVNSVYSLFQLYTNFDFILRADHKSAFGLCGNVNFFGSLIVTLLGIVTMYYMLNSKKQHSVFIIILFFISLINCQSTGPFLTYIIFLIFVPIYLLRKDKFVLKKYAILIVVLLCTFFLIRGINSVDRKKNNINLKDEYALETLKYTISTGGTHRIDIWKNTIKVIEKNWLIGVGYENLYLSYPGNKLNRGSIFIPTSNGLIEKPLTYDEYITDNAHNVYLHIFVETGIFGIISYLLMCLITFIRGLKSKKEEVLILLGGFITYSIQAFANISVITVAPIYYIVIGLILALTKNEKNSLTSIKK